MGLSAFSGVIAVVFVQCTGTCINSPNSSLGSSGEEQQEEEEHPDALPDWTWSFGHRSASQEENRSLGPRCGRHLRLVVGSLR